MSARRLNATIALLATFALGACHQVPQSTAASGEAGQIRASNQPASGTLRVDSIGMPSTGWLVLHAMQDGNPDLSGSIGHAYVPAGPSSDVAVAVTTAVAPGDQIMAMLHLDTGNAKVFEFGNGAVQPQDLPVMRDGKPVAAVVTLQ